MAKERDLKPGEYRPGDDTAAPSPELVTVYHADLDRSMVVRRSRLAAMDPAWVVQEPEELKGAALDVALEDAGLSKTGSADEKRARLAEHEATTAASESSRDAAVTPIENTEE